MKNKIKFFKIVILLAMIVFKLSACGEDINHETVELGRTPSITRTVPANVDKISFIGVSGHNYTESSIVVERRSTPLIIVLENVYAVGRRGRNGNWHEDGGNGMSVIRVDGTPIDITIFNQGLQNGLIGGEGGTGGGGSRGNRGRRGGKGATPIIGVNKLTITGSATLVLGGGNGGRGGEGGGSNSLTNFGNPGGHGGDAGIAVTANQFIVNMTLAGVTIQAAKGGGGGPPWGNSSRGNPGQDDTKKYENISGSSIEPQILGGGLDNK